MLGSRGDSSAHLPNGPRAAQGARVARPESQGQCKPGSDDCRAQPDGAWHAHTCVHVHICTHHLLPRQPLRGWPYASSPVPPLSLVGPGVAIFPLVIAAHFTIPHPKQAPAPS